MNYESVSGYYTKNGYPVTAFNLFGIRDESRQSEDLINDTLGFFTDKGEFFSCNGTTDPGVYWVKSSERNKAGTFHLADGFHENIWTFGIHRGYKALVNDYRTCRPTSGWRDTNFDFTKDRGDVTVCDYFGIDFHRMHPKIIVQRIGKYSAGCQVVQSPRDFAYIMQKAVESGLKIFNYCIIMKGELL